MKPSERIAEIQDELIREDWVNWAGNRFSRETWMDQCKDSPSYAILAIVKFLNEKFPE